MVEKKENQRLDHNEAWEEAQILQSMLNDWYPELGKNFTAEQYQTQYNDLHWKDNWIDFENRTLKMPYGYMETDQPFYNSPGVEEFREKKLLVYYATGEQTLDILDHYREQADILKGILPDNERSVAFGKLLEQKKFEGSEGYKELAASLDDISADNIVKTEYFRKMCLPQVIQGIKELCQEFAPQIVDDIDGRLGNTKFVFLDAFRSYAVSAVKKLRIDVSGFYNPLDDAVVTTPFAVNNAEILKKIGDDQELYMSYFSAVVIHEFFHAASFKRFLTIWRKENEQDRKIFVAQSTLRTGISSADREEKFNLSWLNEGITQYLTCLITEKNKIGDEEFDKLVDKKEKSIYSKEQSLVAYMLKNISKEILFGAYFDGNKLADLDNECRNNLGMSLEEMDEIVRSASDEKIGLAKLQEILSKKR